MTGEEYRSLYDVVHSENEEKKPDTFMRFVSGKSMAVRTPVSAVLELSPICNLSCKMCYIRKNMEQVAEEGGLLSLVQWKSIVDQCNALGIWGFTLTGGECLLFPDFVELYNYIYEITPCVTIMTNAALINETHIDLFKRKPPRMLSITVYGSSRETYGRLCGNSGAYDQVMSSLKRLKEINANFKIQMTVVRENVEDLAAVMQLARKLNVPFGCMDSLITTGNADDSIRDAEQADHVRVLEILNSALCRDTDRPKITERDFLDFRMRSGVPIRKGLRCTAARNALTITWQGEMKPCTVLDAYKSSVLDNDFRKTWDNMVKWADSLNVLPECYTCPFAAKCVPCIAQHYNDTHDFSKPSPRLCWKQQHPEEAAKLEAECEAKLRAEGVTPR